MAWILNRRYTLLFFIAFLAGYAYATAPNTCENGKVSISEDCRRISGLQDFLNQANHDLSAVDWSKNRALLRECLRDVRTKNMALLADSKAGCPTPDDQAFRLLTKLGQEEVREYEAQHSNRDDVLDLKYVDPQCFGSICYQSRRTEVYNPTEGVGAAR
jgi:hypothetical protein